LRGAAFYLASLQNTNLSGCDLRGANLTAVVLKDVDMRDANLEGIRYDDATLGFLAGLDLSRAKIDANLRKDLEELGSPAIP